MKASTAADDIEQLHLVPTRPSTSTASATTCLTSASRRRRCPSRSRAARKYRASPHPLRLCELVDRILAVVLAARSALARYASVGCSDPPQPRPDGPGRRHSPQRRYLCASPRLARRTSGGNPQRDSSARFYPLGALCWSRRSRGCSSPAVCSGTSGPSSSLAGEGAGDRYPGSLGMSPAPARRRSLPAITNYAAREHRGSPGSSNSARSTGCRSCSPR
jgi:hypothetical protein